MHKFYDLQVLSRRHVKTKPKLDGRLCPEWVVSVFQAVWGLFWSRESRQGGCLLGVVFTFDCHHCAIIVSELKVADNKCGCE